MKNMGNRRQELKDTVRDTLPDLLVIAFGMNDSGIFHSELILTSCNYATLAGITASIEIKVTGSKHLIYLNGILVLYVIDYSNLFTCT